MSICEKTQQTKDKKRKNRGPNQRKAEKQAEEKLALLSSIADSLAKPIEFPAENASEDEDSIFAKYVASRLRNINDRRIKARLVAQINRAISDAELASLDVQGPGTCILPMSQPTQFYSSPTTGARGPFMDLMNNSFVEPNFSQADPSFMKL